ncbi:MAG: phosphonate ABC transporter, permease protein PhnE, partial [Sulfuricella sp.]
MKPTQAVPSATALPPKPRNLFPVWLATVLAVLWLIVRDLEISFETLAYGVADMGEYFSRYRQPDFSNLSRYMELMGVTLATALWGTVFALV